MDFQTQKKLAVYI